jgi:ATP-dependent metalloprotease FtsH
LKGPQKYISLGARIPKGVLLVGPPGTGKTLLGKAVAGEAGVQFLSISGSDFVELYVGVGAARVRDLFDQAKKLAPAIIFIDEIDAVGRHRGAGLGGGHDEREQTLHQLLVEMDGFTTNEGVIVMAATNRADILDNALLRPGRFDRTVYVGLPDIKGREAILRVHAKGKVLGDDVDLRSIAKGTPGFTGADLENLLNEAALLAARYNKRFITMQEIEAATLKVIAGPEKKSRVVTEKDRKLTAYHEAGHAVVSQHLTHVDPVHHISIIPRGQAGGMTIYRPQEDKSFNSRSEMFERIVSSLGGRMAEKIMLDDISTGAASDIQTASAIARSMVTKYGMSDSLGPISFDDSSHSIFIGRDFSHIKSYSEKTAALIDDEVKRIFDEAMAKCEEILTEHKDILIKTADISLRTRRWTAKISNTCASITGSPAKETEAGRVGKPRRRLCRVLRGVPAGQTTAALTPLLRKKTTARAVRNSVSMQPPALWPELLLSDGRRLEEMHERQIRGPKKIHRRRLVFRFDRPADLSGDQVRPGTDCAVYHRSFGRTDSPPPPPPCFRKNPPAVQGGGNHPGDLVLCRRRLSSGFAVYKSHRRPPTGFCRPARHL